MNQPTVYATLMDKRTDGAVREMEALVERAAEGLVGQLASQLAELWRKTYMAGVADGFAQGVAAESARHEEEGYSHARAESMAEARNTEAWQESKWADREADE